MLNIVRRQTALGRTVFLSTHLFGIAEELADRIGIFQRGKLIFLGTVPEFRERQGNDGGLEELFLEMTQSEERQAPAGNITRRRGERGGVQRLRRVRRVAALGFSKRLKMKKPPNPTMGSEGWLLPRRRV